MRSHIRRRIYEQNPIDHLELFEHHNWICGICGDKIDRNLRLPHDRAATIDHIVPLSRGGEHIWSNIQPAHAQCNFDKADRMMIGYGTGPDDGGTVGNRGRSNGKTGNKKQKVKNYSRFPVRARAW